MNEKDNGKNFMVEKVEKIVKKVMNKDFTGHDYFHIERVKKLALFIASKEKVKVNKELLQLLALLHDIEDWKIKRKVDVKKILKAIGIEKEKISLIMSEIKRISFKGAYVDSKPKTIEGKIVQDADRLDALGAIGIARCFATGSMLKKQIYNPKIKPKLHKSFSEYKRSKSTSINHFYEKLLLLKEKMNTKTAKRIASKRQKFMEDFLKEFFEEWEMKDL